MEASNPAPQLRPVPHHLGATGKASLHKGYQEQDNSWEPIPSPGGRRWFKLEVSQRELHLQEDPRHGRLRRPTAPTPTRRYWGAGWMEWFTEEQQA